jgi:murein DD-endopeptidase MepM/ murein hydrolase activator NlpD
MPRSDHDKISHSALAALAMLVAFSLGGCATAPAGHTQLNWPVGTTYIVRSGDTVSEIAETYGIPQDAFVRYNGLDHPGHIYVGQVLRIPRNARVAESVPVARPSYTPPHREARAASHKRYEHRAPKPQRVREAQAYSGPLHFIWPVVGRVISPFGATPSGGRNDGINIAAHRGEPIRAAAGGTVIYAGDELKNYGNLVLIRHHDGYVTAYAHAERIAVDRGAAVKKGEVIGYAGATGDVTRPQVHFEIRHGVHPVDPKPLLVASLGA